MASGVVGGGDRPSRPSAGSRRAATRTNTGPVDREDAVGELQVSCVGHVITGIQVARERHDGLVAQPPAPATHTRFEPPASRS